MKQRLNIFAKGLDVVKPLFTINQFVHKSTLEYALIELVKIRVSQINQCAYCLDMHIKDTRAKGETEQRVYGLSAWREFPFYSERERAALSLAEAVTACKVTDEVFAEAQQHFNEEELTALVMAITNINTWNRINITFVASEPGTYQVGMFG